MKKTLIIVLFTALGFSAAAQPGEDYHFSVKDNSIIWQQVYESPVDLLAVLDYLLGSGSFSDVVEISNGISFAITPRRVDIRAAGLALGSTAMYVSNYSMTAHGLLQLKEGRYHVTVGRIEFIDDGKQTPVETYALNRRGEFKSVFVSMNAARAIDHELSELFKIRIDKDEEW